MAFRPKVAPVIRDTSDEYQRENREVVKRLSQVPMNSGAIVEDVAVKNAAAVTVTHNLGRLPVGFVVIDRDSAVNVFRTPNTNPTTTTISLTASANATVSLWVF